MSFRLLTRHFRSFIRVLLLAAAVTATALGCGWLGTPDSVRFNSYQSERDMGRLPPLPTMANGLNTLRASWGGEDVSKSSEDDYADGERQTKKVDEFWDEAAAFEKEGNLKAERDRLTEYLKQTAVARHLWFNPADREKRRNASFDKLDALTALTHGSPASRVKAYLTARTLYDQHGPDEEIERALDQAASDVNLKDNVAYLRAARLYRDEQFEEAAQAFKTLSRQYPHSEKREASIFMTAVATMKTSLAYTPTSGDEAHLHEGEEDKRHEVELDDAYRAALAGFKRVMAEYPRGRYFNDARGWVAYLMLRADDRAKALAEYYRLLSDERDEDARTEAAVSLEMVRHHATDDELARVESEIADEPRVALTYAYHSIFNFSIDPGPVDLDFESVNDANGNYDPDASRKLHNQQLREVNKSRHEISWETLERVLAFTRRLMDRYPSLAMGGAFSVRAAQASVELDKNDDAVRFAQRALQSGVANNERAQALWTIGVAEHQLKHLAVARKSLETLIRDYPKSDLTNGARRLLAMVAEDEGDIDTALEQYIAIGYTIDVAYLVDTLMTIDQLAQFIDRHPDLADKNTLTYSLGVRYLRAGLWNEARATFAKVQAVPDPDASVYSSGCWQVDPTKACTDPKDVTWTDEEDEPTITHHLIMRDIQTANDLEWLERVVKRAPDNEAAAEAMYQLASYQYEATTLLFYNPIVWAGERYWNLSYLAVEGRYRTTNEPQLLLAYMQEHETLARALKIYLEIVEHYPHTRAARDALYTAAVCHERLSNYNPYWRDLYSAGLHAGERMVTYADVKAAYPTYQLPRGTSGWQPSTRTVNNGPGWAAPPKYVPPPSRWTRLLWKVEDVLHRIYVFWNEKVRRWITFLFLLFGVGFTARIAAQNRRLLRPKIVRVRLAAQSRATEPPWTTLFWQDSWQTGRIEKLKHFLSERGIEFWELARDRGSRPILLRNILSHSFLLGLVISLFRFLHFG